MQHSRRGFIKAAITAGLAFTGVLASGNAAFALQAAAQDPIPHIDVIVEKVPPGHAFFSGPTDARGMLYFRHLDPGYYEVRDPADTVRAGIRHAGGPARWQLRQQRDLRRPIWTLADQSDPL